MTIAQRKHNEALNIELAYEKATTDAAGPTLATEGVMLPETPIYELSALDLVKTVTSSTGDNRVKLFGYRTRSYTQTANVNAERETGYWVQFFDTVDYDSMSGLGAFSRSFLLQGVTGFRRVAAQVVTNGATGPKLSIFLSLTKKVG
jgi:hypothetical protein